MGTIIETKRGEYQDAILDQTEDGDRKDGGEGVYRRGRVTRESGYIGITGIDGEGRMGIL